MSKTPRRIKTFDADWESWRVYDYNCGSGNGNVFFMTTWEKTGGMDNGRTALGGWVWRLMGP